LGLPFFGLTHEYRLALFNTIHEIVFHGQGGYDWHTVYNMPIWLRMFTFNKMKEYYDNQNTAQKDAEESWINKNSEAAKASAKIPDYARQPAKRSPSYNPTTSTKK